MEVNNLISAVIVYKECSSQIVPKAIAEVKKIQPMLQNYSDTSDAISEFILNCCQNRIVEASKSFGEQYEISYVVKDMKGKQNIMLFYLLTLFSIINQDVSFRIKLKFESETDMEFYYFQGTALATMIRQNNILFRGATIGLL